MKVRRRHVVVASVAVLLAGTVVAVANSFTVTSGHLDTASTVVSLTTTSSTSTTSTTVGAVDSTCTLRPNADTFIDEKAPTVVGGAATTLRVGPKTSQVTRALVKFDVTNGLCAESGAGIPAGSAISAATVRLFVATPPTNATTHELGKVVGMWTEATTTWTLGGSALTATGATAQPVAPAATSVAWTVTADAQSFFALPATNNGWRIIDPQVTTSNNFEMTYHSRESATSPTDRRPQLVVTYR